MLTHTSIFHRKNRHQDLFIGFLPGLDCDAIESLFFLIAVKSGSISKCQDVDVLCFSWQKREQTEMSHFSIWSYLPFSSDFSCCWHCWLVLWPHTVWLRRTLDADSAQHAICCMSNILNSVISISMKRSIMRFNSVQSFPVSSAVTDNNMVWCLSFCPGYRWRVTGRALPWHYSNLKIEKRLAMSSFKGASFSIEIPQLLVCHRSGRDQNNNWTLIVLCWCSFRCSVRPWVWATPGWK